MHEFQKVSSFLCTCDYEKQNSKLSNRTTHIGQNLQGALRKEDSMRMDSCRKKIRHNDPRRKTKNT
jgi:hypothetical protein